MSATTIRGQVNSAVLEIGFDVRAINSSADAKRLIARAIRVGHMSLNCGCYSGTHLEYRQERFSLDLYVYSDGAVIITGQGGGKSISDTTSAPVHLTGLLRTLAGA